jgi:hypothetical protein
MSSLLSVPQAFALIVCQISPEAQVGTTQAGSLLVQLPWSGMGLSRFIGLFFIAAIVLVFFLAVVLLWRYQRGLPAEHEALERVEWNYKKLLPTQERNPDVINQQLLIDVDRDTAAAERVIKLHSIRSQGGDFEQAPLAEVLATREGAKISFAKYVSSILVLLGLCGAILGLSNLVFQMGPELRTMQELNKRSATTPNPSGAGAAAGQTDNPVDKSIDGLIDTMANSLAHTWSAFAASLLGIITSIGLLYFNLRISGRQVKFLTELEDLTATKLIPIFNPPRELAELSGAVEAFKEASTYVSALSSDLEKTSTRVVDSMLNFDEIVYKFRAGTETLQQNHERIYDAQTAMLEVAQEHGETIKNIDGHLGHSRQTIETLVNVMLDTDKTLGRVVEEWRGNNEKVLQLIQTVSQDAEKRASEARVETQQAIIELNQLVKDNFTEQLKALSNQCFTLVNDQDERNRRLIRDMSRELKESLKDLKDGLKELQTSPNGDGQKELITNMGDVISRDRSKFTELLAEKLKQESEKFGNRLQEFAVAIKEPRPQALYDVIDDTKVVLRELRDYVRAPKPTVPVFSNRNDTITQDHILDQVSYLNQSFRSLNLMLRIVLGVIGFVVPVVGLLGLTRKFDFWWVADSIGHEVYIGAIIFVGVLVACVLVWLSLRDSDAQRE